LTGLAVNGRIILKFDYETKCGCVAGFVGFNIRVKLRIVQNTITKLWVQ